MASLPHLCCLPTELLAHICRHLERKDVLRLERVSKILLKAIREPHIRGIWGKLTLTGPPNSWRRFDSRNNWWGWTYCAYVALRYTGISELALRFHADELTDAKGDEREVALFMNVVLPKIVEQCPTLPISLRFYGLNPLSQQFARHCDTFTTHEGLAGLQNIQDIQFDMPLPGFIDSNSLKVLCQLSTLRRLHYNGSFGDHKKWEQCTKPPLRMPQSMSALSELEDLGLCGSEQPIDVASMRGLKRLRKMTVTTAVLPHDVSQLTALAELTIRNARMSLIIDKRALSGAALTSLVLHGVDCKTSFGINSPTLRRLEIEDCVWGEPYPDIFGPLPHLQELSIRDTWRQIKDLATFAQLVATLTTLQVLSITSCGMDSLPQQLSRLQGLTLLDLSWNHLRAVPGAIAAFPSLAVLKLDEQRDRNTRKRLNFRPDSLSTLQGCACLRLVQLKGGYTKKCWDDDPAEFAARAAAWRAAKASFIEAQPDCRLILL